MRGWAGYEHGNCILVEPTPADGSRDPDYWARIDADPEMLVFVDVVGSERQVVFSTLARATAFVDRIGGAAVLSVRRIDDPIYGEIRPEDQN